MFKSNKKINWANDTQIQLEELLRLQQQYKSVVINPIDIKGLIRKLEIINNKDSSKL